MSKPYLEVEFSAQVTQDRNWRIREISDLKSAINNGDKSLQKVLLRALVAVCYAHWEGYIKFSARKYFEHISLRKLQYKELRTQFLRNYFLPRLGALSSTKASIADRCSLVDDILNASDLRFSRINDDLVNTKANLNSEVFQDIFLICGVSEDIFKEKATFIDVILLKRRNAIAHGEDTLVAIDDVDEIVNGTIVLMRAFGDALENQVVLHSYRAA